MPSWAWYLIVTSASTGLFMLARLCLILWTVRELKPDEVEVSATKFTYRMRPTAIEF